MTTYDISQQSTRVQRRGLFAAAGALALAGASPPSLNDDVRLIALCTKAEADDDRSSAVLDTVYDLPASHPKWDTAYNESSHIFDECRLGMNEAATIPAATAAGLRAKASLALRELVGSDEDEYPLVLSVLKQVAGRA